jgi:ATP-binding cassette subfamily F protein uup
VGKRDFGKLKLLCTMHYVSAEGLTKAYGIKPLFEDISFNIEEGDKIAVIARNGSGKSTLLKILAGKEIPDEGKLWVHKDVDIALFEQEPSFNEGLSILDNIFDHEHPIISAIKEYEAANEVNDLHRVNAAIIKMDELDAWDFDSKVKLVLSKLNIHGLQQPVKNLSGGQRKRAALARTLIDIGFQHKHVLLMMDEPTNHLDVDMVEWLEFFLTKENVTILLVTHDRYFLDSVCDEIWELDGGNVYAYKGDYEHYLEKKSARVESESASIDKARNIYRKELEWMRKQPRARTTKSKSRQDRFYELEKKAGQRVEDMQMQLQTKMSRLGGKIVELKKVYKTYEDKIILKGFDYTFKKGERIGVIGKNGVGKSTFLNILQNVDQPDSGKVNIGETVVFGNYSQQGLQVKEDLRVIEYVKNIAENFPLASGGSLSASQFLNLFLFPSEQQYTYLSNLSGGERRRLHLLSILFRNPNFLLLDEPTNDLDLPTLGVLENFLNEFAGCLVIVSHDRYFMDRLVDHLFVFEGDGFIRDFPGNYTQYRLWQTQQELPATDYQLPDTAHRFAEQQDPGNRKPETGNAKKKLSYKDKREFELLQKEIEDLTNEKETITKKFADGGLSFEELQNLSQRIGEVSSILDAKEMRWLELSEKMDESS